MNNNYYLILINSWYNCGSQRGSTRDINKAYRYSVGSVKTFLGRCRRYAAYRNSFNKTSPRIDPYENVEIVQLTVSPVVDVNNNPTDDTFHKHVKMTVQQFLDANPGRKPQQLPVVGGKLTKWAIVNSNTNQYTNIWGRCSHAPKLYTRYCDADRRVSYLNKNNGNVYVVREVTVNL